MKILTVNVIGIPSGSSDDLTDSNVFQDYDAIVVNPESLEDLYGSSAVNYVSDGSLMRETGLHILRTNIGRRTQVDALLQRGGAVICFLQPLVNRGCDFGNENRIWFTNYDWLLKSSDVERELRTINSGTGNTIDYIDSGYPFFEYLNTKPPWSAYIDKDACENWKILASAFGTHVVALAKRVGLGYIVLLPSYYDYENGELIERCIIRLLGDKEVTPQPSWARAILVPGQPELISKIIKVGDQIDTLTEQKENLISERDSLERWKWLLYEKGKHQLEPAVRDALALLGYCVEPQHDKDSDGLVTFENEAALLEVGGSKGTIKIEKLGQLTRNMGNFMETKGIKVKGILVGNPFCDEPLENRPPKDGQKQLFARELIESAEQQSIAVLLSTDLYEIVSRILKGELLDPEKRSLQERIFNGKGLVRLV